MLVQSIIASFWGQVGGAAVKTLPEMPVSHIGVLRFSFDLCSPFHLPANTYLGGYQVMVSATPMAVPWLQSGPALFVAGIWE